MGLQVQKFLHSCSWMEFEVFFIPSAPTYMSIPVTGSGDLQHCEMLMISHCLDNQLTDGGKVVSLTQRPRSSPWKHFSASGTHFC
jgi:hypothetical protein